MNNSSSCKKSDHFKLAVLLNRKRKNTGFVQLKNNDEKEVILDHYNYKDALTLSIDDY